MQTNSKQNTKRQRPQKTWANFCKLSEKTSNFKKGVFHTFRIPSRVHFGKWNTSCNKNNGRYSSTIFWTHLINYIFLCKKKLTRIFIAGKSVAPNGKHYSTKKKATVYFLFLPRFYYSGLGESYRSEIWWGCINLW